MAKPRVPRVHVPNRISPGSRLLLGWLAAVWGLWSLIGMLSGHMFVMIGLPLHVDELPLGVMLHFDGWAAGLGAVGALLASTLCALIIVDHHDRRDNEATYNTVYWWLFRTALLLEVAAFVCNIVAPLVVADAQRQFAGLIHAQRLRTLFKSEFVTAWLEPHQVLLVKGGGGALFIGVLAWGVFKGLQAQNKGRAARWFDALASASLLPAFTFGLLWLVLQFASDAISPRNLVNWELAADYAFEASVLLVCGAAWVGLALRAGYKLKRRP